MSAFTCEVVRVSIDPHPNADAIELAQVGGYVSIVRKGQFKDGDLAIYIPEQSVLPQWLLKKMSFWDDLNGKGKLSGSAGNRVRAMKLRGVLSQGLLLVGGHGDDLSPEFILVEADIDENIGRSRSFLLGEDAAEFLGIVKYEPVVPARMSGRLAGGDLDATIGYDFDNLKKQPWLFEGGELVQITEKLHGTLLQIGLVPKSIWENKNWAEKMPDFIVNGETFKGIVTSKGQGAKGLLLDPSDAANLYVKVVTDLDLWPALVKMRKALGVPPDKPIFLLGEIFGIGVQDLGYGQKVTFNAFDAYIGTRSDGFYVSPLQLDDMCESADVCQVPHLYRGPFSHEVVMDLTNGNTTFDVKQIREGIVIRTIADGPSRKIAKSVSEAYLLRKGEVTEFQ